MKNQHAFINRLRSLFNIDRDQLPELTDRRFFLFQYEPARYLIRADDTQAAAIWREVEKRQKPEPDAAPEQHEALERLLFDLEALIDSSHGVAGLHLNGDVAPWSDLTEGGRFESWLAPAVAEARAALAKASSPALQATGEQS